MTSDGAERARQRDELKRLVKKYRNLFDKKKPFGLKKISEADVRQKFIDTLFKILGWDTEKIDSMVYALYGLTDDEIRIIDDAFGDD